MCNVFSACQKKNDTKQTVISSENEDIVKYKNIVKDILCIEAAIYRYQIEGKDYVGAATSFYKWLEAKYDITLDEIKRMTALYVRTGVMQSIMDQIIEELKYVQISLDTIELNTHSTSQKTLKSVFPFQVE